MRAVTADTSLVTLTIGGNDLDLFSTLVRTCTQLRASDPQGSRCARRLATQGLDLDAAVATISRNVAGVRGRSGAWHRPRRSCPGRVPAPGARPGQLRRAAARGR